jgi:hypothetical protein
MQIHTRFGITMIWMEVLMVMGMIQINVMASKIWAMAEMGALLLIPLQTPYGAEVFGTVSWTIHSSRVGVCDGNCVMCGQTETTDHIFFSCGFANFMWSGIRAILNVARNPSSVAQFYHIILPLLIATRGLFRFYLLLSWRSGISVIKLLWKILSLSSRLIICSKLSYFCSNGGLCSEVRTWRSWSYWRTCFANFIAILTYLQGPSF